MKKSRYSAQQWLLKTYEDSFLYFVFVFPKKIEQNFTLGVLNVVMGSLARDHTKSALLLFPFLPHIQREILHTVLGR